MQKKNYIPPQCALVLVDGSADVLDATVIGHAHSFGEADRDFNFTAKRRRVIIDDDEDDYDIQQSDSTSIIDEIVAW